MKQPKDIVLGLGWTVRFQDAEMPVFIEYKRGNHSGGASLAFFEQNFSTSCDEETPAPQKVIDRFEASSELIYAWEQDWFDRNPREE